MIPAIDAISLDLTQARLEAIAASTLSLLGIGLAMVASACSPWAHHSPKSPDFTIQQQWQHTSEDPAGKSFAITTPTQLLEVFDSPNLLALFSQAEKNNFDLKRSAAQLERAANNAKIDKSHLWPSLGLTLGTYQTDSKLDTSADDYQLQAKLSWEIDLWGRLRDQSSAANYQLDAAIADYQAARLSLAGNLAIQWFAYLAAYRQVQLSTTHLHNAGLLVKTAEQRYRQGLESALAQSQARAALADARASVLQSQRDLANTQQQLQRTLGPNQHEIAPLFTLTDEMLPLLKTSSPVNLPIEVVRQRPDIISAERHYRAAVQLWQAAAKQRLPNLTLTANANRQSSTIGSLGSAETTHLLAAEILTPLFDFGRRRAEHDRAGADAEQAFQDYSQQVHQALIETQYYLNDDAALTKQFKAEQVVEEENQRYRNFARHSYQNGLTDLDTLLQAEQNYIAARRSLIHLQQQWLQRRIQLLLAIGGKMPGMENTLVGTSPNIDNTVTPEQPAQTQYTPDKS